MVARGGGPRRMPVILSSYGWGRRTSFKTVPLLGVMQYAWILTNNDVTYTAPPSGKHEWKQQNNQDIWSDAAMHTTSQDHRRKERKEKINERSWQHNIKGINSNILHEYIVTWSWYMHHPYICAEWTIFIWTLNPLLEFDVVVLGTLNHVLEVLAILLFIL